MSNRFWCAIFPLAFVASVGCAGKSVETSTFDPNGVASGGDGSAGMGGESSGGTGGSIAGNPSCTYAPCAPPGNPACPGFSNQVGSTVPVKIVNDTQRAIYVGATQLQPFTPFFQIEDASGRPRYWIDNFCSATCENPNSFPSLCSTPGLSPVNSVLALEPGQSVMSEWNGSLFTTVERPPECDPPSCAQLKLAEPGVYKFVAQAGSTLECPDSANGCPACMPAEGGGCTTPDAIIAGDLLSTEIDVTIDSTHGVADGEHTLELHFKN